MIRKVLIAAAQKKVADSLLSISENQVSQLENTIRLLGLKDSTQKLFYESQLTEFRNQVVLYKDQINGYEKLLKRERRKRFFTAAGGVVATGLTLFLYLQK